ncbi:MAG TPA: cation:proton antiporter [Candidatus Nanoarchaeia archaeon]|nr:cation:proton antiporter [Candidatus Nanoarchaeia archaeon]
MEPLTTLLICLGILYLFSELLQFFKIPRVVSQISVGIVLGLPFIKDALFTDESLSILKFLAYVGSILLLFFVGLGLDFKQLKKNLGASLNISLFNTILPLAFGFLASKYLFGLSDIVSLLVGVCMSVSATAFALDLLEEYGKLKTALGALIVDAGATDDFVELMLVASILAVIGVVGAKFSILVLILNVIIFLVILLIFRFILIPFILTIVERKMYKPALFTAALLITLLLAVLAEYLKIGAIIGALFGGLIIRQVLKTDKAHGPYERTEITHVVHAIGFGFLIPLFFLWIGLNTDIISIWQNINFSLTITVLAIFGTVFGSAFGYWLVSKNWKNGWKVGWALNAKGDTELVIAQVALGSGIISKDIFSSLIFMALISTLISPFVFEYLLKK